MKLAVIADVHGNDVALRAVLDDADLHRRRHPNAAFVQTVLTGDQE